jgi:hypothetical protein
MQPQKRGHPQLDKLDKNQNHFLLLQYLSRQILNQCHRHNYCAPRTLSGSVQSGSRLWFGLLTPNLAGNGLAALTLRTGTAWLHAIAPHVLVDTPLVVKIFHIT